METTNCGQALPVRHTNLEVTTKVRPINPFKTSVWAAILVEGQWKEPCLDWLKKRGGNVWKALPYAWCIRMDSTSRTPALEKRCFARAVSDFWDGETESQASANPWAYYGRAGLVPTVEMILGPLSPKGRTEMGSGEMHLRGRRGLSSSHNDSPYL